MSRSVLVAGGDRGVGKAIADQFAALDDWVAVTYQSGEPPDDLFAVPCDIADPTQVETAYREVEDAHGPVEVLVAHAEITCSMPMVQRVAGQMRWGDWGRIILIASAVAFRRDTGECAHATPAEGLAGLARALGRDLNGHGVTVNVVALGLTGSDVASRQRYEGSGPEEAKRPPDRAASLEDVAAVVTFLASPEASHITGTVIPVNGAAGRDT